MSTLRQRIRPVVLNWVLFFVAATFYYATSAGTTSSNDGSHYALLRSMADEGRFEISTYAHFAEGNDLAIRNDIIYSDRPPGTALYSIPIYLLGRTLPQIAPLPTRHDEGNPALAYVMMVPVAAGAATIVILFHTLRSYDLSMFASLTTTLAFALGTTSWKYGSVLYSHSLSAFAIMAAVSLTLISIRDGYIRIRTGMALGVLLGGAVLVEYSNVLFVALILIYLTVSLNRALFTTPLWWLPLLWLVVGLGANAAFLLYYNTVNFGGPFQTSYDFAINYPWAASLATTFDIPLWRGLPAMLWYGVDAVGQENQGIFLLMPVTLLGIGGVYYYFKERWQEAVLTTGIFLVYLLLFSMHHTFSGFTFDGRYLMPFLALWFIPVGFAFEHIMFEDDAVLWALLLFIGYGLLFLSIRNQFAHVAFSYNYHLDPGLVVRRAATPNNWGYILGNVFVNWRNVPLLWAVVIIATGVGSALAFAFEAVSAWFSQRVQTLDGP